MSSETTQTVGIYDVLAWLEANKKAVIICFSVVVVLWFGFEIYQWKSEQTELAASDALMDLTTPAAVRDTATPPDPSAYLKVAQEYPSTTAGQRALLLAASSLFTEGKYTEAQTRFSQFLHDRPQGAFAATAAYGIATCLEAEGKRDDALAAYQNLSVRFPNSSVLEDAKLAMARIYEAKKQPEQALRLYDELAKPSSMGSVGSEAMTLRQDLLLQHPELAKTNAPTATATNLVNLAKTNASAGASNSVKAVVKTNAAGATTK